ncbi:hypothetical protein ACIBTP_29210 [Streptomyces avidinii]|uniref:hypothetical protein n=1 Tax=Streptomyces avidinii TaxID=1895 RepID=UPI00379C8768
MSAHPSDDPAAAFARLGGEDDGQVWSDLWNDLCHQGCVYEDSFLALPYLAAIATGRAPGEPQEAVLMAGLIVSAADGEHGARYAMAFGDHGTFASAGDYVTADPVRAALLPADPRTLGPLPARLHRTASRAGHEQVALGLTYLFGRAACPECGTEFAVPEQVEER